MLASIKYRLWLFTSRPSIRLTSLTPWVDPNVLEDLEQGIADELPYGFEPSRSF